MGKLNMKLTLEHTLLLLLLERLIDPHNSKYDNTLQFNVAQMLVQHRLKTDPNLENQLRAASAVVRSYSSRRIIR